MGDAAIFQCFLSTHNAEFNSFNLTECVFHHGGKCSDISRHFAKNPMSMGSNWVFVIDSDAPANSLATMLHGKYKKNINAEVFVCQFKTKSVKTDVELEDLLPPSLLNQAVSSAVGEVNLSFSVTLPEIDALKVGHKEYIEQLQSEGVDSKYIDEFKERFKKCLNDIIFDVCKGIKNKAEFVEKFPDYSHWALEEMNRVSKCIRSRNADTQSSRNKSKKKKQDSSTSTG